MKVILIGGYPGVGKSFVVKKLIELIRSKIGGDDFEEMSEYSMPYMIKRMKDKDLIIMGSYKHNEKFPGTDRFSMGVQPYFEQFLKKHKDDNVVILLEGDRLFNGKTIGHLWAQRIPYNIVIIRADEKITKERRESRSFQNETWRKGRKTKVDNIAKQTPFAISINNDTEEQAEVAANRILQLIKR